MYTKIIIIVNIIRPAGYKNPVTIRWKSDFEWDSNKQQLTNHHKKKSTYIIDQVSKFCAYSICILLIFDKPLPTNRFNSVLTLSLIEPHKFVDSKWLFI